MADSSHAPRDDLETLARARFGALSKAELKLLRAAPRGELAVCGPSEDDSDPANDPAKADTWEREREIRAELIRWLCVDVEAARKADPRGIQVFAAKVTGKLDLSFARVSFPLGLFRCRLTDDADLSYAQIPALSLAGSCTRSIAAESARVTGSVFLNDKFTAEGEVRLLSAQIGGNLDCSRGTFKNPHTPKNSDAKALSADRASVTGSVFLCENFSAEGEVRLLGAQIGGQLACNGGIFKNPGGHALSADRARVTSGVFLRDNFTAEGEVRLPGAQIGSDLDCSGGTFTNPRPPKSTESTALTRDASKVVGSGVALDASGAHVTGYVFLRDRFSAEGEVRLLGAEIGRDLSCSGGAFKNPGSKALSADGARVTGDVFLGDKFAAEGEVRLPGAQIGSDLSCNGGTFSALNAETVVIKGEFFWRQIQNPGSAELNLTNASAGAIVDDQASWPSKGKLRLDGFTYDRISAGRREAKTHLEWLERVDEFTLQPFQQLAKVLRETGDTRGARKVLFEMERLRRAQDAKKLIGLRRWAARLWGTLLRATVGYGYYPETAFLWLIILMISGCLLFRSADVFRAMTPTEKEAYSYFRGSGRRAPSYDAFNSLIYSLENSFPFIRLGQADRWQPDPDPKWSGCSPAAGVSPVLCWAVSPGFLRWFRWAQICAGWFLATLFVAGLTGKVRAG